MAKDTLKGQAKKTAKKLHVVLKTMDGSVAPNGDFEAYHKEISGKLTAAGLASDVGSIAFAGRTSAGSGQVQLNIPSGGFSSTWPEWAYGVAEGALHFNKKVWVIYSGSSPFGANLLNVLCLKDSV